MGKCKFIDAWTEEYDWVAKDVNNIYNAICKPCKKSFSIKSGGVGHIVSHSTSKMHCEKYTKWSKLTKFFPMKPSNSDENSKHDTVNNDPPMLVVNVGTTDILKSEIL